MLDGNKANAKAVSALAVQSIGPRAMNRVIEELTALLRERHKIQSSVDDDLSFRNLPDVFTAQESSAQVISILRGTIASVSLIVGGIGIMLVPETERTREIGLCLAVGAKTREILTQFLVEAVTLSALGAVIGIIVGMSASILISRIAGWSNEVSALPVVMAFFLSALVGGFFGYYPARKAAFLDPMDALVHV